MSVGCGPSLGDHPAIDIFAAQTAYGYIATITILVLRTALDNLARDFVCKRERSSLTNGICLALYRTRLATLRRIDTEQSNPYAVYFDCVAIDNRCAATIVCGLTGELVTGGVLAG
jgi:hypothetical protein